ncbi:hypothetical protein [Streptomyces sp. N35]|uniref:hypothetical protein n=1 Tax=Streptomyces sp. N35 TaxID=2795730 RepID=UPI0018F2F338|nr:hypothetical protein [Streptomyces sp. N35]
MMRHKTGLRIAAALSTAAALGALTGTPAGAATDSAKAVPCQQGYVCYVEYGEFVSERIAQGESRTFDPAITITDITNWTTMGYCISGNPNTGLAPGRSLTVTQTITAIRAVPAGGACAT